jgi:hypothetical protein
MKKNQYLLSEGASFKPVNLQPEFNQDITALLMHNALTYAFIETEPGKWVLRFTVDPSKIDLSDISTSKIIFRLKYLSVGVSTESILITWNLSDLTFDLSIDKEVNEGPLIVLYALFNASNTQISRYIRWYIPKDHLDVTYDYFDALFRSCISNPVSYQLPSNEYGFYLKFSELFSSFIKGWEQGFFFSGHSISPEPPTGYFYLNLPTPLLGSFNLGGVVYQDGDNYYFYEGFEVPIECVPAQFCRFVEFVGADAGDVVLDSENHYHIVMNANKELSGIFQEKEYRVVNIPVFEHGEYWLEGFDHGLTPTFYFNPGYAGTLHITPAEGYQVGSVTSQESIQLSQIDSVTWGFVAAVDCSINVVMVPVVPPGPFGIAHFHVVDNKQQNIYGATLHIDGLNDQITDQDGLCTFTLVPMGTHQYICSHAGFLDVSGQFTFYFETEETFQISMYPV